METTQITNQIGLQSAKRSALLTFDGARTLAADFKICSKCKQTKPLSEYYKGQYQCKVCCNKHQKKYRQTEEGKACQRRYHYPYPERIKAKNFVNHAIRDGKLSRPDIKLCLYCPKSAQQYHHYLGYEPEHWLDILPVCRKCHTRIHKRTISESCSRMLPRVVTLRDNLKNADP